MNVASSFLTAILVDWKTSNAFKILKKNYFQPKTLYKFSNSYQSVINASPATPRLKTLSSINPFLEPTGRCAQSNELNQDRGRHGIQDKVAPAR